MEHMCMKNYEHNSKSCAEQKNLVSLLLSERQINFIIDGEVNYPDETKLVNAHLD